MRWKVRQLQSLYQNKTLACEQVVSHCHALAVAGEEVWQLGAWEHILPLDELIDQARQSTERIKQGRALSALDGLPVAIKSNLAVKALPLTAGSRILGANVNKDVNTTFSNIDKQSSSLPCAGYNADTVQALINGGAIIMGSTRMDEFGMGSLGSTSPYTHATKNPLPLLRQWQRINNGINIHDVSLSTDKLYKLHEACYLKDDGDDDAHLLHFSAGGSSSGSACSVAHGSSVVALGSDTGGSIRLPAAWCGLVGLKPTYGKLSRHGLVPYASSFDTVGIIGSTSDCVRTTLNQIIQHQRNDRDSNQSSFGQQQQQQDDTTATLDFGKLNVGIPAAFSVGECPDSVKRSWNSLAKKLQQLGANVRIIPNETLSPTLIQASLAAYYVLASAEAASNLSRYDGVRYGVQFTDDSIDTLDNVKDNELAGYSYLEKQYSSTRTFGFHPEVIRRLLCGTLVLSSDRFHTYYEAAAQVRAMIAQELRQTVMSSSDSLDVVLIPTSITSPPRLDQPIDSTAMLSHDLMTVSVNLAGLPSLTIPYGEWNGNNGSNSFSMGFQLVGAPQSEDLLLNIAARLEESIA